METVFQPLSGVRGIRAAFIPRLPDVDVDADRETALARLAPHHRAFMAREGFDPEALATAEQVHGDVVAVADEPRLHMGADALITDRHDLVLGIYVADCAAVYFVDRKGRAIGLAHSGRAGTALNITGRTLARMQECFGVEPSDVIVQVSPCIRPPLYESDFASDIIKQARACGVGDVRDAGICTGQEVACFYSYRVEQGRTGRMLALLSFNP